MQEHPVWNFHKDRRVVYPLETTGPEGPAMDFWSELTWNSQVSQANHYV